MSISTLQEKLFSKGCFTAFAVIAAVAMGASMFTRFGGGSPSSRGQNGEDATNAVAFVGEAPVTSDAIQKATEAYVARLSPGGPPDPTVQAMAATQATGAMLQSAAISALLAKGSVTDADVTAAALISIDRSLQGARTQLIGEGRLKPTATEADLQTALKDALRGKTISQLRTETPKEVLARFKDPAQRAGVVGQLGSDLLVLRLGTKSVGDDKALRDSYKSDIVRRIFLGTASGSKETPQARAQKVEVDLKAGKSFDTEMDAFSNDPSAAGQKIHDATETVPATTLISRPELASLVGKMAGTTTGIVDVPGGKAIYQLVSVKDDLPTDFEANKAKYRLQKIQAAGEAEASKEVKALLAGSEVKWQDPGYKALAITSQALQPIGNRMLILDPKAGKAAFDAGEAALKSENANDRRLGAQALLVATDYKFSPMKSPEATANRMAALEAAQANGIEDPTLDLELAGLYGDAKNGAKVAGALVAASKANSDYDTEGQRTFGDIAAKALDLQKKNVLSSAQLQMVQSQQAVWTVARAENAKVASQAKTEGAQDKLSNEAEIARQKAEASQGSASAASAAAAKANQEEIARQKAAAKTPPASPKAGGSLLPPGAGR